MMNSNKLLALDLFCGGGGAAIGLMQAGFEVVGIDNKMHKHYPGNFILGDALNPPVKLSDFDLVWASPPCQLFSKGTGSQRNREKYKDMNFIPQTRDLLLPHPITIIENVPQAPIRPDLILTGQAFAGTLGLHRLWRRRHFELSFWCWGLPLGNTPSSCITVTKSMCSNTHFYRRKRMGLKGRPPLWKSKWVMGIPFKYQFTYSEVGEAVPPPYSKYIAQQAIPQIRRENV